MEDEGLFRREAGDGGVEEEGAFDEEADGGEEDDGEGDFGGDEELLGVEAGGVLRGV